MKLHSEDMVLNGGGTITREYAEGCGCMDRFMEYGGKWSITEIKLVRPLFDSTPAGRALSWEESNQLRPRATPGVRVGHPNFTK